MARTLAWRCWVSGCSVTKETRAALQKHAIKDHRRVLLKLLKVPDPTLRLEKRIARGEEPTTPAAEAVKVSTRDDV